MLFSVFVHACSFYLFHISTFSSYIGGFMNENDRRPCRHRDDWALSPCSGIHSAECGPVVQQGVFGLKIGRNSTNYREPAFQIVGIVVKIVVKAKWGQPINKKIQRFLTWNRWIFGPSGENRTHGLLNPIQARYQNCATPGYRPPLPYRSVATWNIILRCSSFVNRFLQFSLLFS